jgi:hypothetical protein
MSDAAALTFKQRNREIQEMVRELMVLRSHNLKFGPNDPQDTFLLFAEAAVVIVIIERFVRALLGPEATDKDTLWPLLEKLVNRKVLVLPFRDQKEGIKVICGVRNAILHGNFEQAAAHEGLATPAEFFKTRFAVWVETTTKVVDKLMAQIDPDTGLPRLDQTILKAAEIWRAATERVISDPAVKNELIRVGMANFPAGACGTSCRMFGEFLRAYDVGTTLVTGRRTGGATHAWLEYGTLAIDVTAGQFPDRPQVYVGRDRSWYETTFCDIDRQEIAPLDSVGDATLLEAYSLIVNALPFKHGSEAAADHEVRATLTY